MPTDALVTDDPPERRAVDPSPDTSGPGPDGRGRRRQMLVLALLITFQLMVATDLTAANVAMPAIQASLGFSTVDLSWVINAYTLVFGGVLLLGGRIGDMVGRRRAFLVGMAVFTFASLLAGFAPSPGVLLAARAVQGLGTGLAAPSALALVASNFPDESRRKRAIGLYAPSGALGASVGLLLGGTLTDWVSWRWILWVNVPVGIGLLLLTPRLVGESKRQRARIDLAGAVTSTAGVAALVYAFIRAAGEGWQDSGTLAALTGAVLLLGTFVLVELRHSAPVTPMRLFADRDRSVGFGVMMPLIAIMAGNFFFMAQFLQEVKGYSPVSTGMAFMPMTLAVILLSEPAARLSARVGVPRVSSVGAFLMFLGSLWLSQVSVTTGYWAGLFGPLVLLGVGMAGNLGILTVLTMERVDDRDVGSASGLVQVVQQFGMSIGLAVLVTAFAVGRPTVVDAPGLDRAAAAADAFTEGLGAAYSLGSVMAVVALALTFGLTRPR